MLLARGAVQYVRPDVCMAGGLTHAQEDRRAGRGPPRRRRAAQPAEPGQHRRLRPARRLHPQLRPAGVPAGRARAAEERDRQEARSGWRAGYLSSPTRPGIGIELAEDAAANVHRPATGSAPASTPTARWWTSSLEPDGPHPAFGIPPLPCGRGHQTHDRAWRGDPAGRPYRTSGERWQQPG